MRTIIACILFGLSVGISGTAASAQNDSGSGYLGVGLADSPQGAPAGAMVARIDPDGPAARAGLQQGDLIRSVNGRAIGDAHALQTYVFSQAAGSVLKMEVLRWAGSAFTSTRVTATLSSGPGDRASPANANHDTGSPSSRTGAQPEAPAAESGKAEVRYVRYADPAENAFAVPVPAGWRVGGRMVRYGPVSIAPFVQAMTPDGAIFVQLGDWHIKDYCDIPGWQDGKLYTPGTSVEIVRRVQNAEQYGHSYSLGFQQELGCENPTFTGSKPLETPSGLATVPQAKVETNLTEFKCERGGQVYAGRVMVTVQAYQLPISVGWNIVYLASVLARQERAAVAFSVFDKMRTGFAFEPAWSAQEAQIARQATRPAMEALNSTLRQA